MRLSDLSRRHKVLLGMAALFALVGTLATVLTTNPDLDRGALARLAAEAALDPVATGSLK
jgi:hypothetical protein